MVDTSARFWKRGVLPDAGIYSDPKQLMASAIEYFDWSTDNSLFEERAFAYQGSVTIEDLRKPRVFTLRGLCNWLGVALKEWPALKGKSPEIARVCEWAEEIIYQQKFELAAADLLNAAFIARDLGMTEKRELTGAGGRPLSIITSEVDASTAAEMYADTLRR